MSSVSETASRRTFALIGAGPYTGLETARLFGRQGFRVAMVARRRQSLDEMARELESEGIEAHGFVADLRDEDALKKALAAIRESCGTVDVLLFAPHQMDFTPPSEVTAATARHFFELLVAPLITCVQDVLPDMLLKGDGAVLFATGRSAIQPMKMLGAISPSSAGARHYCYELHDELKPKGIYVGVITISGLIDTPFAEGIAAVLLDMYQKRDRIESTFGYELDDLDHISKLVQKALDDYVDPEVPMTVEGFDQLLASVRVNAPTTT